MSCTIVPEAEVLNIHRASCDLILIHLHIHNNITIEMSLNRVQTQPIVWQQLIQSWNIHISNKAATITVVST